MLCYETNNRMKAIKAKNLWSAHFDKGFDMKVNDGSTLIMVKSQRYWRVIDLQSHDFSEQLEGWVNEIKQAINE